MGDVDNKRRKIFLSLSKLECGPPEISSTEICLRPTFLANWNKRDKMFLLLSQSSMLKLPIVSKTHFKRRATAVPNSIDRLKHGSSVTFETKSCYYRVARQALPCYTAVARLGFKGRATAVPNSIDKL